MTTSTPAAARRSDEAVLSLRGVSKTYGALRALNDVSMDLLPGEVHALLGDNGAGKSTLVKIATGVIRPDAGTVALHGESMDFDSPLDARRAGIETVFQDLALSEDRSCVANVFAGREMTKPGLGGRLGFLDRAAMAARCEETFRELSLTIKSPRQLVRGLSGGQKQGVAIARAAMWARNVVLMDEPTAALGVPQRRQVTDLIERLRETGRGVLLISHDVPEVLRIADRITILRQGERVATCNASDVDVLWVVSAMVEGEGSDAR